MKKIFLFIGLILGTSLSAFANETPVSVTDKTTPTVHLKEVSANENSASFKSSQNSLSNTTTQDAMQKKKKKKLKTWQYIAGGAFILVVVVLYVATGGQGLSSR